MRRFSNEHSIKIFIQNIEYFINISSIRGFTKLTSFRMHIQFESQLLSGVVDLGQFCSF